MADQKVNIKVTTQGATKAKQEMGGLSGAIGKMGKAVGIASAAYFGARGLISGLSSVITLAGEQEQAEKRLEVALGKTSNALLKQASALQQMTTFGDEAIIGVQASIGAFVDSEDQIKKATEATLDMAVAMGMDLKGAGDLIAKTLGSSTNALSRYGIEVTGAVGSTERLESLTSNVAKLFGGQAKAQAETLTGQIEQMKNAVGDAAEVIGALLAPMVITTAKSIKFMAEQVDGLIEKFREFGDEETLVKIFTQQETEIEKFRKSIDGLTKKELKDLGDSFGFILTDEETEKLNIINEKILMMTSSFGDANAKTDEFSFNIEKVNSGIEQTGVNAVSFGETLFATLGASSQALGQLGNTWMQVAQVGGKQNKTLFEIGKAGAVAGAIMNTSEGVTKALAKYPPPMSFALAALVGAAGATEVATIMGTQMKKAETGFEGVVTRPTMFLTGENNKPEQVSVTPLGGGSASGITVNISAPLVDDTVVESIIPAIERAKRMNLA